MKRDSNDVLVKYESLDDLDRVIFLEGYIKQLRLALSEKTNKINHFNEKFCAVRKALKTRYPGNSRVLTYKEELKVARMKSRKAILAKNSKELENMGLQLDIAALKAENQILKTKIEE
jgi:hypothetical protein